MRGHTLIFNPVMEAPPEFEKIRRLLEVGRTLVSELDTETVLRRILDEARAITGACYAAIGVLDEQRTELERFITSGIDDATHRSIGSLPRGRGVLGVLIEDPRPLRLSDVGRHPQSFGFPVNHPPMATFLGVPILIRGQAWGNLYLSEKETGGGFTEADEDAAIVLAQWAATAIENARLYESSERRRKEAERALLGLRAARDITDAIAGVNDLNRVLELIVKRGRALVDARAVLIMLREEDELLVAAAAGHSGEARGRRLPIASSTSGRVLQRGQAERISDVARHLQFSPGQLGIPDVHTALLVPMIHRGTAVGVLAAFDHGKDAGTFSAEDEQLLHSFAASAANAVTIHRSVEADRLRAAITAADAERARWARELHDQTLQALGGLRVLLASAQRRNPAIATEPAIGQAIEEIELETDNLRAIITDLRPSLLDDLGLGPAIDALLERRRISGMEIVSEVSIDNLDPLDPDLETTIYRLVQESLTNIAKHANAATVRVLVRVSDAEALAEVRDDGTGFDTDSRTSGFGLAGMRERVYLAGGRLEIESSSDGTTVCARIPVGARGAASESGANQMAS
jgi:two-component system, NarL family, sensor histidine kinase DevS